MKAYFALPLAAALTLSALPASADEPAGAPSAASPAPTRVRSRAMLGTGAILTVIGGFGLLVATPFTISAATCGTRCGQHDVSLWPMMVAGGVFLSVGVPLIIVGSQKVSDPPPPAARPALLVGPTGAAMRVQF